MEWPPAAVHKAVNAKALCSRRRRTLPLVVVVRVVMVRMVVVRVVVAMVVANRLDVLVHVAVLRMAVLVLMRVRMAVLMRVCMFVVTRLVVPVRMAVLCMAVLVPVRVLALVRMLVRMQLRRVLDRLGCRDSAAMLALHVEPGHHAVCAAAEHSLNRDLHTSCDAHVS